jgi:hypothetical protein
MNFGGGEPPVGRKLGGGGFSGFVKNVYYDEFQWYDKQGTIP